MLTSLLISSQTQAQALFDTLPAKFRDSAVGHIYAQVIKLLGEDGQVQADAALSQLFPELTMPQARKELSTRYINRPHVQEDGRAPLRMQMSRSAPKKNLPSLINFASETAVAPLLLDPSSPRYEAAHFTEALAERKTSEEIAHDEALQIVKPEEKSQRATERIETAQRDMMLAPTGGVANRPLHGLHSSSLRRGVDADHFQRTQGHLSEGIDAYEGDARNDLHALQMARSSNRKPSRNDSEPVNALDAMLQWALQYEPQGQPQHRLLALLGDYGTGKTSHCVQFTRVLNGQVPNPQWDQLLANLHPQHSAPKALMLDLAELADVGNLPSLDLSDMISLILRKKTAGDAMNEPGMSFEAQAQAHIAQARVGQLIMVFDGLDELLRNDRSVLTQVFAQLMRVLEPSQAQMQAKQPSLARVMISCRTHYFRDAQDLRGFLNTRQRGVAQASQYLRLSLLPWGSDDVQSYLRKRLSAAEADQLQHTIETTYNLQELASRPVLLAMMSEQLGELLRLKEDGQPITASRMYGITVSEWVQRDGGKHRMSAAHKPVLMGALASAMWSAGAEAWEVERLDRWLVRTLKTLFPGQYDAQQVQALQDDLRTATFIVRPGAERFAFAHRSFAEYFLARFWWDALYLSWLGDLSDEALRGLLPNQPLNQESRQFLAEIWQEQSARHSPQELTEICAPVWRLLQQGGDARLFLDESMFDVPWQAAPELHANVWRIALELKMPMPPVDSIKMDQPINLRGLQFVGEQWQDADLRGLPALDCRGTNFLALRAHRCQLGVVLCSPQTNWAQALLRDCDTARVQWRGADTKGLLVRRGDIRQKWLKDGKAVRGLRGPWSAVVQRAAINAVAFSPDGRSVLTGSDDYTARLWSADTGQSLREFKGHGGRVWSVAFSPDGCNVLTGSDDETARLWSTETGQSLREFKGHEDSVICVTYSPNGDSVLTGSTEQAARLWNSKTGELVCDFEDSATSVAYSPDSRSILIGGNDETASIFDSETGKILRNFKGHSGMVESVTFSPDGARVLTGSDDYTARIWSGVTGQLLHELKGHSSWVSSVAFSRNGHHVVTGSDDKTTRIWSSETGQELLRLLGHESLVTSVACSPDGLTVLTGSDDNTARVWSTKSGRNLREFKAHGSRVMSIVFSPDGCNLLTSSLDSAARLWSCKTGELLREFRLRTGCATSIAFSPDGRSILTGSEDGTVLLWSSETGNLKRQFKWHGEAIWSMVFSPDSNRVLTGSGEETARLWDAQTGHLLFEFKGHDDSILSVAFDFDGRNIMTGSRDGTACLWSADTGQRLHVFKANRSDITNVAFARDGENVLISGVDNIARLWSRNTGKVLHEFKVNGNSLKGIDFSSDGGSLLTCGHDDRAYLWSSKTKKLLREFKVHGSSVGTVAFRPDGRAIALGHNAGVEIIDIYATKPLEPHTRVLVHGQYGPSTALFDIEGNLLDCDNEAADTWLYRLGDKGPEPLESAPVVEMPD